jgi:hypothetical protein
VSLQYIACPFLAPDAFPPKTEVRCVPVEPAGRGRCVRCTRLDLGCEWAAPQKRGRKPRCVFRYAVRLQRRLTASGPLQGLSATATSSLSKRVFAPIATRYISDQCQSHTRNSQLMALSVPRNKQQTATIPPPYKTTRSLSSPQRSQVLPWPRPQLSLRPRQPAHGHRPYTDPIRGAAPLPAEGAIFTALWSLTLRKTLPPARSNTTLLRAISRRRRRVRPTCPCGMWRRQRKLPYPTWVEAEPR